MFWPYESMFITVKSSASGVYLEGLSNNWGKGGHKNSVASPILPNFEIVFLSKPEGDIPVSGTVNTIQIPNVASSSDKQTWSCPAGSTVEYTIVEGMGKLLFLHFVTASSYIRASIVCDDNIAWTLDIGPAHLYNWYGYGQSGGPITVTKKYVEGTGMLYTFRFALPVSFKRKLSLKIYNAGGTDETGHYIAVYEVIS